MGRPIDREKRRGLAQRAVTALEKLGVEATMTQLARELGVKRPTLLYHFPTRSAIVEVVLQELLAEQAIFVIGRMEAEEHPIDQLFEQIRAVQEFHDGREARLLFLTQMAIAAGSQRTDELIRVGNMAFEARRQIVGQRLRAGIEAGTVVPCDVDSVIRIVRSFNDGLMVQRVMTGCEIEPLLTFIWEHVLGPLKRDPSS